MNFWFSKAELPRKDNLHIKDKTSAPNLSVIKKFLLYSNVSITLKLVDGT